MADESLMDLVEAGDFRRLHERVTIDEIADAWLGSQADAEDDPGWWAVVAWYDEPDEERRRDLLLRLIEKADADRLGRVAAGPLESFVTDDESRLRWLERQAEASEKFRRALAQVRVWELPDRAFGRVEAAAGTSLAHPDRDAYERRQLRP